MLLVIPLKRNDNLYCNIYDISNIMQAFNEVCRNTKNKKKVKVNLDKYIL